MKKLGLVSLTVTGAVPPFLKGEVAGFAPGHAQKLVEERRAVYNDPPPGLDKHGKKLEAAPKPKPKRKKKPASKKKGTAAPKTKPAAAPKTK
jgi:hypothetical protein